MKVPVEFKALGSAFYAGSYVDGMSADEWISARVSILDAQEKEVSYISYMRLLLSGERPGYRI